MSTCLSSVIASSKSVYEKTIWIEELWEQITYLQINAYRQVCFFPKSATFMKYESIN